LSRDPAFYTPRKIKLTKENVVLLTVKLGLPLLRDAFTQDRLLIQAPNRPMLCAYRYLDRVCSIGAMIPDASYGPNFEGLNLKGLVRNGLLQIPADEQPVLAQIQARHDTGELLQFVQLLNAILEANGYGPV
jgi:hypothetical protein